MNILIFNVGSTSQKVCLYCLSELPAEAPKPLWTGQIDWSHESGKAEFRLQTIEGRTQQFSNDSTSQLEDRQALLKQLWQGETSVLNSMDEIDIVGHRVVHGGTKYHHSVWITPEVEADIAEFAIFAPIHNVANLAGIQTIATILPNVPQVAVFDTSFHQQLPTAAYTYPGPYEWLAQGIRRYGFHGISHEYCAQRSAQLLQRDLLQLKLITCHLGGGCSLAAIRQGISVDTSMGFTPLDGLMMGTRSGAIDPGILLHLIRQDNLSVGQLEDLLNRQSGLLGISGISSDMRKIQAAIVQGNDRAKLAFDLFIHRLRTSIGGMLMSLDGLDALVFTAGIGENSAEVRAATCQSWDWLGIELDPATNFQVQPGVNVDIATTASTVRILVIHTQEDWMIAQACWKIAQA